MGWNPEYYYKIRGTWAKRGFEQIIVFNLKNAMSAVPIPQDDESGKTRRINLCPEE